MLKDNLTKSLRLDQPVIQIRDLIFAFISFICHAGLVFIGVSTLYKIAKSMPLDFVNNTVLILSSLAIATYCFILAVEWNVIVLALFRFIKQRQNRPRL